MESILSVVALVLSVLSGAFAVYTFFWTTRRDRKQATLEAFNRLQAEVFDELNRLSPKDIREHCQNRRSPEYKVLSGYLARIEHFCVGLNENIYDKATFYALAHGYFDGEQMHERLQPVIDSKNCRNKDGHLFYNDIYAVWAWMNKRSARN